jgi:hypothetical protein
MCSLICSPDGAPRRSLSSSALRTSIGSSPQILAVELQEVEGKQEHRGRKPPLAQELELGNAVLAAAYRFAVDQETGEKNA